MGELSSKSVVGKREPRAVCRPREAPERRAANAFGTRPALRNCRAPLFVDIRRAPGRVAVCLSAMSNWPNDVDRLGTSS